MADPRGEAIRPADLEPLLAALRSLSDGDFSVRAEETRDGVVGAMALALNRTAARNEHLAAELSRVRREVVREGRLDERMTPGPGHGGWAEGIDDVNQLVEALATPVVGATQALGAVADGDLTQRMALHDGSRRLNGDLRGLADELNRAMDQLSLFTGEVTRVAHEVGTEGDLGGQVTVRGLSGAWRDVGESVNTMTGRLTRQVRDIAEVTTAVARGDLTRKVTVETAGELLALKVTVNTMVDRLSAFADEVTRVAREVGTEGNLGGQAQVRGVSGVWKDLTDNVNSMAQNLTAQVRNIAQVTTAVADGDLSQKITVSAKGEILQLVSTVNLMVDRLSAFADEVTRVAREVGTEGNLGGQAQVRDVSGVWKDLTDNVNSMALNLTSQVRNIAQVTTAVANGDVSKKIDVDARGEILELKTTVNTMVEQLRAFADEVTRVAREVGTEGHLGGRAQVQGVSGVWRDLTDNVNSMAQNLTSQVRNIAQVATAVANGDLSKKIDVDARGEILELKTTLNTMVDTLSSFSSEVTRVAREVGSEGRLGGQARVEGVYGTWKQLTTGVNDLALNLTTQVRAIAEVASAVTQGDMSRSITVQAQGEVAELKNNVNVMVTNLRETTRTKDWLESNLTRIAGQMRGHRELVDVADLILRELAPLVNAQAGAFFLVDPEADAGEELTFVAGYGTDGDHPHADGKVHPDGRSPLTGLIAQAVREKERILVEEAPPDYVTVRSGLGSAPASSILILPVLFEDQALGVIEVASFSRFNEIHLTFLDQFVHTIGVSINTILANARTESLLAESQRLTSELRQRSEELQRSNAELEEKAELLASSSQYKSEFLANMSHELRTPLNSLLILARLLTDNPEGRMSRQEVEFASTIHRSGSDLLQLINDILDLSKVEAGRMDVRPKRLPLTKLLDFVRSTFRPLTADRGLTFRITVEDDAPRDLYSDEQRLQQVLRNLLSNAVKFTPSGGVELHVARVPPDRFAESTLRNAETVLAFSVRDTGIGIPAHELATIFDAFRQSDGTTNRKYGGTGLGLSISREIAQLLGGRIDVESEEGAGSRFTLHVPAVCPSGRGPDRDTAEPRVRGHTPATTAEALPETWSDTASAPSRPSLPRTRPAPPQPAQPARPAPAGEPAPADEQPGPGTPTPAAPEAEPSAGADPEAGTGRAAAEPAVPDQGAVEATWPETTQLNRWLTGPAGEVLAGRHVLIVDDDIRNVFALTHVLGRVGISVKYAENGLEGLEALDRSPEICLVLMDIMMPGMNGYQAIRTIRATPRIADMPIIAITAKAMSGDRDKALESGADAYVPKPVEVDSLLEMVYELLRSRDAGEPTGPSSAPDGGADAGSAADGEAEGNEDGEAEEDAGPSEPQR